MSDGNFNRNILPYQNYQSGLRAGKAMAKAKAIELLEHLLADESLEKADIVALFKQRLDQALSI